MLLEYVTTPHCRDCRRFEVLLAGVLPDYPTVEGCPVAADSERGRELSLVRGIMRFPIIVLDGEVIAVESISGEQLRRHLQQLADG